MRFNIDGDTGDFIRGWVFPDNPTSIGRVVVVVDGRRVAEISTLEFDTNIAALGWHATGQCRFEISENEVPDLANITQLEIYDLDTNILVYRRVPQQELLNRRLLLINTSINPENALQSLLFRHFQQSYFGVGKLNEQMLQSIFSNSSLISCFLSGALIVPRYEHYFQTEESLTTALIHDPHVEMATRLIWLRARAADAADPNLSWRLGPLADAAIFAAEHDFADLKSLKRLFRMLPEPAYRLLYNPLTRQFGTKLPDDRLHPGNSIVAIEILARVGIVGHRDYFEAFVTSVLDRLGLDAPIPKPEPISQEAQDLAKRLRSIKAVEDMLLFDIAMSDAVRSSVAKTWDIA